jgi:hypothetical protein
MPIGLQTEFTRQSSANPVSNNLGLTIVEGMIAFALLCGIYLAQLTYSDSVDRAHDIAMRRWQVQLVAESVVSAITSMSDWSLQNFLNQMTTTHVFSTETPYTFSTVAVSAPNTCTVTPALCTWLSNWKNTRPSIIQGITLTICLIEQKNLRNPSNQSLYLINGVAQCPASPAIPTIVPTQIGTPTLPDTSTLVRYVKVEVDYEKFFGASLQPSYQPTRFSWTALPAPSLFLWQ